MRRLGTFLKKNLIMTHVFMYVLELREFFRGDLIDQARDAHRIVVLKTYLQSCPSLLSDFSLDEELVLSGNIFRYFICYFSHYFIVFLFAVSYYIYENVQRKLYSRESFLDKVFQVVSIISFSCPMIVWLHSYCQSSLIAQNFILRLSTKLLKMTRSLSQIFNLPNIVVYEFLRSLWRSIGLLRLDMIQKAVFEQSATFGKMFFGIQEVSKL